MMFGPINMKLNFALSQIVVNGVINKFTLFFYFTCSKISLTADVSEPVLSKS